MADALGDALANFDGDVSPDRLRKWLNQFAVEDQPIILALLRNFRYYSLKRFRARLEPLSDRITKRVQQSGSRVLYVPVGYVAKSGGLMSYLYRIENEVPEDRFVGLAELRSFVPNRATALVFLDDFIGSGDQAIETWRSVQGQLPRQVKLFYAVIVGFRRSIGRIQRESGLDVICADVLTEADLPLSDQSAVFPSLNERNRAREILKGYGARIDKRYPLGFKDTQCTVGFFYSTPNNTFPIFWGTSDQWKPLLPRVDLLSDFTQEPETSSSGVRGPVSAPQPSGWTRPLASLSSRPQEHVDPDTAQKIIQEFHSVEALAALSPAFTRLGLSASCAASWLDMSTNLRGLTHEGRDVVASLLVIQRDVKQVGLDARFIEPAEALTLADTDAVLGFMQLVNGLSGCTVAQTDGRVLGNALFTESDAPTAKLVSSSLARAVRTTMSGGSLMLTSQGGGRLSIFYLGNRILTCRGAGWKVSSPETSDRITRAAAIHGIEEAIILEVIETCLEAGDVGLGALVTLGDEESVVKRASPMSSIDFSLRSVAFGRTRRSALLSLISADGATIACADGRVVASSVNLATYDSDKGEILPGRGTRHATASKISGGTSALVILTSSDGGVRMFSRGLFILELMT